ncbi:ferric reductase [Pseudooceanicola sp. 216_PA32_1]|uniref:Ferric reductase n=2 Tax=Pseudooceanicola pacificus TaxID=2676438 RepID=A0A844WFG7_9RHOB|nr:ferric reductase [Pseudooceanicola pacificus]
MRPAMIWLCLLILATGPVVLAASSPFLAYRGPEYIAGGFAGIIALSLMLIQPLLAAGALPGLSLARARLWHRRLGGALIACTAVHVGGLYLTSPPDTLDALLLAAPTPFSVYGVLAMWGILLTGGLALLRRQIAPRIWRLAHNALALVVVAATVAHAVQITGAMELRSKWTLCLAVLGATGITLFRLRVLTPLRRRGASRG